MNDLDTSPFFKLYDVLLECKGNGEVMRVTTDAKSLSSFKFLQRVLRRSFVKALNAFNLLEFYLPNSQESEIKIIKRFQICQADADAQITFLGSEPYDMEIDQTSKKDDSDETGLSGFTVQCDDDCLLPHCQAFPGCQTPPWSSTMKRLRTLKHQVCIKEFPLTLVRESIEEKLTLSDEQVKQTLQDQLPSIVLKPINKQFNAFNTLSATDSSKEATMRITRGNDPLNLTVYEREPGRRGSCFYNGNFDLVFQREEEFHLATTAQLIRHQNAIKRGSLDAEEMFAKLELTIEARNDVTKARKIVKDNLDGLDQHVGRLLAGIEGLAECKASASNLRRIQVKDIVKEVEDYLKTYSSAEMDIS
ncbi:hypothetical protein Tco_0935040 [Tanacetum coccineum]